MNGVKKTFTYSMPVGTQLTIIPSTAFPYNANIYIQPMSALENNASYTVSLQGIKGISGATLVYHLTNSHLQLCKQSVIKSFPLDIQIQIQHIQKECK